MPTHLWLSSLTAFFCWPPFPLTAISHRLVSSALHCRLHLSVLLTDPLSFWDFPFFLHFRSRGRSRPQSFVWVSRQSRQRDSLTSTHTPTPNTTNGHIVLQFEIHQYFRIQKEQNVFANFSKPTETVKSRKQVDKKNLEMFLHGAN